MAKSNKFVPPSRLARMGSAVLYHLFFRPLEKLAGRWWGPHKVKTVRGRIAFWAIYKGWGHYERAAGRL